MKRKSIALTTLVVVGLVFVSNFASAAEDFVTPGPNVNAVGVTPNPSILRVPDLWRKQQNEPSCVQATDNPADVICGANDCRAADWPEVHGDCWIGVMQSRDFGETWTSRLAPGYNAHPHSLGMGFAADPSFTEIPGSSPGLMLLAYITSFRDSDEGAIVLQRYVKSPREDGEPYLPEDAPPKILATGSEGRFLDKVASIFIVNDNEPQSSTNESINVEDLVDPVVINALDGTWIIAYSVFTGNGNSVKIMVQTCTDAGRICSNPKKVSQELNVVTGVHLSYVPDVGLSLVYRRSRDSNENDGIVQAFSRNLGRTWTKTKTVFEICPHDQQASGSTPRMFTFPWGADDGERFWVFSSDKVDPATGERIFSQGNCDQVAGAPPGTYPGVPRIVGMSSLDGKNWYGSAENPDEPFILDFNGGIGYQMFPFAQGDKNKVNIAFWDTRDEEAIRPPPAGTELPLIYDYLTSGGSRVFRTANIYMTRITGCKATTTQGACTPHLPTDEGLKAPVKISRYQTAELNGTLQEVESNRLCLRTHGSGKLCYNGDYGAIGTRRFRRLPSGKVVQNSLGPQPDETNFVAEENIVVAWGENRDVFGDFVGNPADPNAQFLYSPPENAAPGLQSPGFQSENADSPDSTETPLASKGIELKAVNEPDDDPALGPTGDTVVCSSANNHSFARDSNVYASYVEDKPNMIALAQARQMNTTQRMFPLVISYPGTDPLGANYCLAIANQPPDYGAGRGSGRASFNPLPALNNPDPNEPLSPVLELLDVHVDSKSSAARSVFVTSSDATTRITVNAYEGMCPPGPSSNLISSAQVGDGELFDPAFCDQDPTPAACLPVATNETHNIQFAPGLQSPGLQSPGLQSEILQAPGLQSLLLGAPGLQSEGLLAPGFQSPGLQSPGLQSPGFQSVTYAANSLISPGLQSPGLQSPGLQSALENPDADGNVDIYYQDFTRTVIAEANVTTTYSADIAVQGLDPDETWVQLFAWQPNVHTTSRVDPDTDRCFALPEADNKIIAAVDMGSPGLQSPGFQSAGLGDVSLPFAFHEGDQNPFIGDVTFAGKPGDLINITTRIWVSGADASTGTAKETLERLYECSMSETPPASCLQQEMDHGGFLLVPFGGAAHGCNTADVGDQDPNVDCISAGAEKIVPPDIFPPVFFPDNGGSVAHEAESPGGALVDTPGTVPDGISVSDADPDVSVFCTSQTVTLNDGTTQFPFGDTLVSCTAIDTALNQSDADITISIVDSVAPEITVPADISGVEATGFGGATVNFITTATDVTNTTIDCTPGSGSTFALGTTAVSCTATDQGGNTATDTFDVTVQDTMPPILVGLPVDFSVEADQLSGAFIVYVPPTANDLADPAPTVGCVPLPNAVFPLGATPVTCMATDASGNASFGGFTVTIVDTTDPVLDNIPADITAAASSSSGASVSFTPPTATDLGSPLGVSCNANSGDTFPIGTTTVTCSATDASGNTASASFDITVEDTTAPVVDAHADVTAVIDDTSGAIVSFAVTATDDVDPSPAVSCSPASGSLFAPGTTTVTCSATDNSGNTSADSTFDVKVGYAIGIALGSNKNSVKAGAVAGFTWGWADSSGNLVYTGEGNHDIEARPGTCPSTSDDILDEDPGSSGFHVGGDGTISFNWQTDDEFGNPVPADQYCVRAILLITGDYMETGIRVRR